MKTIENIKKVSLIFFIILGLAHIFSGLFMTKGYFMPLSQTLYRILDLPFAITTVVYCFANIQTHIPANKQKISSIVFIGVTICIFLGLLYINLFIPDKPL